MIKRISVLLLAAMLAIAPGCANDADMEIKNPAAPDIVSVYGYPDSGTYYYGGDRKSGVGYLSYEHTYRHAITVMLNPDGLPVTADQLGITYER